MKNFQNIKSNSYKFKGCNICDAQCCDGRRGSLYSDILLDEFESISKRFPILFLKDYLNFLKPVILLTNGKGFCRYLEDHKCSIYEYRPSVCQAYPISPDISNNIFIDLGCPAVSDMGETIVDNGEVSEKFYNETLNDNYQKAFLGTYDNFKSFNNEKNLELVTTLRNINFYKFKSHMDNRFVKLHLKSIKNFDNYYKES